MYFPRSLTTLHTWTLYEMLLVAPTSHFRQAGIMNCKKLESTALGCF
jgi:hypothetical protein